MKNRFKMLVLMLLVQTTQLYAQTSNPWRIGFGISNGIPTDKNPYGYILGGDIKLQKDLTPRLAATFSAGFNHYFEKQTFNPLTYEPAPWNSIPLKAGLKVFAGHHLYFAGEAGAGLFLEGGKPSFLWSPAIGMAFSNGLDMSIKYEDISHYKALRQVALRVAYGVNLQRTPGMHSTVHQDDWRLYAAINPGVSLTQSRFVIGADLELERHLAEQFALTLSGGFTHFTNKPFTYGYYQTSPDLPQVDLKANTDKNLVPVKLGIKIFPVNKYYLAGAAGIGVDINGNSSFLFSASTGVKLNTKLDLGLKYENYTDFYSTNQLALRIAYRIF